VFIAKDYRRIIAENRNLKRARIVESAEFGLAADYETNI
jgi:hypothetical protein